MRGEYNQRLALQANSLYKINGSACRSLPIKTQSKAFAPGERLPIKHTIEGFACRSQPINIQSKASACGRLPLSSLHLLYPSHPPKPEQTSAGALNKGAGGVRCRHLPTPGGTPKAGTCSSERRAGIVFYW